MDPRSNICATTCWTRATSSIKPSARHRSNAINLEDLWEARSRGQMFMFGTYEGFQQRLARSSASIVPGTFARQGLLPNGSPVPDLKPQMLKYANAFWPAPSTPDRPDGTAVAYANPGETIGENFGLARFDHILSST